MRRIAIFVEGQTEQIFVQRLLTEVAGRRRIRIEARRLHGGRRFGPIYLEITASNDDNGEPYYALITDCGSYTRVASEIREKTPNLVAVGYEMIIGLRDVDPFTYHDIAKIQDSFAKAMRECAVSPRLVLVDKI